MNEASDIQTPFIEQLEVQMRKGVIVYAVLLLCSHGKIYSSQIISRLQQAELLVVEGTLYPLLSRLARDGMLEYEWQESDQGPPRKYYWLSEAGEAALVALHPRYDQLHAAVRKLQKGTL